MKTILMSKFAKKILILTFLLVSLVFAVPSAKVVESASARPCCEDCPVPPNSLGTIAAYCTNECGSSSGTCYNTCYSQASNCQMHCSIGCGGGGGYCVADYDCPTGLGCPNPLCVGGSCYCE